jgi:hypothetical protein
VGQGLLIIEASRSHSDTPHSIVLLWMSDQSDAEAATCTTHSTQERQTSMPPVGFEPAVPVSGRPFFGIRDLRLVLTSGLFPSGFPINTLYAPLCLPHGATGPAHLILLDFITRIIFSG